MTNDVRDALRKALEAARRSRVRGPFEAVEEQELEEAEPSPSPTTPPAPEPPLRPS